MSKDSQEPVAGQQAVSEKGQEHDGSSHLQDAKRERNKNFFAELNREQVLELLDALKLSQYREAFKENAIDGDLLIKGCDESALENDLGISSSLHRRKLMRLITGEYSAEEYFNLCSQSTTELKNTQCSVHGSKSKQIPVQIDSGDPSTSTSLASQDQTRSRETQRNAYEGELQQFHQPASVQQLIAVYDVLNGDEVPVDLKSGIPDTRYSSVGIPKGLSPPPKRSISVVFHVLLAIEAWQWDDTTSRAHIRFGHHELGNWKINCGEVTWSRDVDETLMQMALTLPIDKSILECAAPLPYAYAVYSGSLESVGSPLEHLYGAPHLPVKGGEGDFVTRCLIIPPRELWKQEFHQYDTICYPGQAKPQVVPRDNLTQIFIKALRKFKHYPANTSYSIDSPEVMLRKCLEAYLIDYCNELTSYDTSVAVGIDKTVDRIMHIYKCLSSQLLHYTHSKEHTSIPGTNIEKVMQGWLLQTSRSLKGTETPSRKRLISAAVIILCLQKLSRDCLKSLPIRSMSTLLKIVTLTPSKQTRQCPDYEHLCKYILPADKPLLSDAIHTLCNTVLKSRGGEEVEWLQALPLYHFLKGFTQPFGMLNFKTFQELKFKAIFGDLRKSIDIAAKGTDLNAEEGIIDRYYGAIKNLLDVDPLLVEVLVYLCPAEELPRLFLLVPPYLAVAGVAKLVHDFLPTSSPQNMTNYFKTITDGVRMSAVSAQWPGDSYQERLYLVKACQWVLMEVILKLQNTSQHSVELVNATICLVLYGLNQFTQLQDVNSDRQQQNVFRKLSTHLKAWVSQHLSVLALINLALAKAKEEMKLWDSFLQLDCPSELEKEWEHAVENIMRERIAQVDDGMKVNLVCVPELDSDHTQVCTARTLEIAAARAIQAMGPAEAVKNVEQILGSRLKHINAVFKILMDERFQENSLELTDLLEWKLWPCLIKHFGGSGSVAAENPKMMSCLAYHKVIVFHDQIQDGTMTVRDLAAIKGNIEQMKQLLAAASMKKLMLDRRLAQLDCTQLYHKQVGNFHLHHHDLENEGIVDLKKDADTDLNLMKLNDVIDTDRHPPAFRCLISTMYLREYIEDFYTLTVEHCSDLFLMFWKEEIATKRRRFRELASVVKQTWQSTFEHCDKFISSLRTENMEITEIEKMFGEKEEGHIRQEITKLFHGFNKCKKRKESDSWIERVVKRIIILRSLQQYSEAAMSVLELKDCLGLTREFREVKSLSIEASTAVKKKCLKDINQEIIETGDSLKAIAGNSENLLCLQAFVKCRAFVVWLKDEFKDVIDLRNFVSVAVATGLGGEDALALQKFSNLELVCSAFGPLIYDLRKESDSVAVFDAWERVWKGAQKTKRMKTILVDLNKEIEWFKEVKKGHSSVEKTSYGQMDAIMKFGVYQIGTSGKELLRNMNAVLIKLSPSATHGKPSAVFQRKMFSLEQLRDLESRLVLMGGSSSTSQDGATEVTEKDNKKRMEIEEFLQLFRQVCQVLDVLAELQNEGHVKYISWHQSFPCSGEHVSRKLQHLVEEMKDDLMTWKEEVTNQRQQFYELNYYTTLQLLHLRQELCNMSTSLSSTVLALLSSISPNVQQCNVTEAVQCAIISLQSQESEQGALPTTQSIQEPTDEGYLKLPELGLVLKKLGEQLPAVVSKPRYFPGEFLAGSPNMVVTHTDDVLKTVVSIYMRDESLPLPTMEEVLLCTDATTAEEVILLWRRAVYDPGYRRIFCLVNAEKLSYNITDKAFRELNQLIQLATKEKERLDYRLVIVCGSDSAKRLHAVSKLEKYKRQYCKVSAADCSDYLRNHYITSSGSAGISKFSRVRVVKSKRAGLGKSLYIQRMRESFPGSRCIILPIHGPVVTADTLMQQLKKHFPVPEFAIFHIDIAPSVLHKVDTVLFGILVLGGLSDSQGRVWRCNFSQKFAVEITEIENASKEVPKTFLEMLPTIECISPEQHLKATKSTKSIAPLDIKEFRTSSFQRVYQYLKRHDRAESIDEFVFRHTFEDTSRQCLGILTKYADKFEEKFCGQKDPSWSEIKHFVEFLNKQMTACEKTDFFKLEDPLGFKSFVVKFMITMSKDFATSSLRCEVARENPDPRNPLLNYQIDKRREWEQSAHPYLFFNRDGQSFTFVGFRIRISNEIGDLLHPETSEVLINDVASLDLLEFLKVNGVDLDEQWQIWSKSTMITKLATVMGLKVETKLNTIEDPDCTYELTVDNLIKMLAIQLRFRSNIPVILMGETGCGKTRLIKYMCQLARQGQELKNFFMLKVHGGTTDVDILSVIKKAVDESPKNMAHNVYTVVFFDEANTTEALSLIKEVMCDHRMYGKKIPSSIKLVAACNPYRRHTDEMIKNLESAGLGFHIKEKDTEDRFGDIPLRKLVYRVLDLPPSMRPLVYDFGQLSPEAEREYVCKIVHNHAVPTLKNIKLTGYDTVESISSAMSSVLSWCQSYMRNRKDECSFVSLRDIERTMIVFEYFYKKMDVFAPAVEKKQPKWKFGWPFFGSRSLPPDCRAFILAISVCYYARLRARDDFEKELVKQLKDAKCSRLALPGGAKQFRDEVTWCQEVILDNMQIGNNIARNTALRENIFMMVVCIELRIPLFVVGKPGSSKSLAKTIVHNSMTGQASDSELMRDLKQVHMFSYQCSQLSTSESIIQVFNSAKEYQSKQNMDHFVSVVVLDEVGLAEDSPGLPLKALHPLLEDGTAGADGSDEVIPVKERVAFIGISNWALDPAKMNRGIMVTRTDPDRDELVQSARGICSNEQNDPVRARLESYFRPLAEAYQEVVSKQEREFYGLRDFYSLIKMLYWKCKKLNQPLSPSDLQYAIRRNFDGFGKFDTVSCFYQRLHIHNLTDASCSDIDLMKDSLKARDITWHGENRYLLLLTKNYAALTATLNVLHDSDDESEIEPYVLFGSGFPKDKEFTQVCCNISRIKHCMQTGRTVILLNLENLYESLYDVLNQYYTEHGGHRFVDLGLQCHRMKCQVHSNFKVILIAEEETVYDRFPTPLINRLEKHRIVMESILEPSKLEILREFQLWIDKFTRVTETRSTEFKPEDAFVGFHKDTPATVVYQAFEVLKSEFLPNEQEELERSFLLSAEFNERAHKYKENVLKRSKYIILQTATPDALIRLRKTGVSEDEQQELSAYYFKVQQHLSLRDFLFHQLIVNEPRETLFLQVTTHSHLPSSIDYEDMGKELDDMEIFCLFLQEFDTELDFTSKISNIIKTSMTPETKPADSENQMKSTTKVQPLEIPETEFMDELIDAGSDQLTSGTITETSQNTQKTFPTQKPPRNNRILIVVQCDAAVTDGSLIACGRYRIYDVVKEEMKRTKNQDNGLNSRLNILYVIHVPRRIDSSSFTGFQPKPWISYHIDSLLPSFGELPLQLDQIQNSPLSELFGMTSGRLSSLIPVASSTVHDSADIERSAWRLNILISIIPKQNDDVTPDQENFYGTLTKHVHNLLKQHDEEVYSEREWVLNEALSPRQLQRGGTLQSALYGKLDDVIVPILAEIIAFTDRNYNLNLINDSNFCKLWLDIFCNPEICKFKYKELFPERLGRQRQEVPGIGGRRCSTDFRCRFPFSWIVKESLDVLLNQALHLAGSNCKVSDLHAQVCRLIDQSPIGGVLKEYPVNESSAAQLLESGYLYDFIRMSYAPKHNTETETQLLIKAVDQVAQHLYQDSLVSRLAAVHVVFHTVRKEILWFGQLVTVNPIILAPLMFVSTTEESCDMTLHLKAVGETLEIIDATLPLKLANTQKSAYAWLQSVYSCQRAVNSALHLPVGTSQSKELVSKLSLRWQRQQAVQLFIEHFVIQHSSLVSYTQQLNETLVGSSDFTKVTAIEAIVSVLSSLSDDHKQRRLSTTTCKISWIQQTSYNFFTEAVSNLCFGWTVPDDEVIYKLMSIAFPEDSNHLPFLAVKRDGMPSICPFVLNLLLKQDFQKCERYLANYFERLQPHGEKSQDILLQCIQGFEDSYHLQMSELPHTRKIQETLKHTKEAYSELTSSSSAQTLSSLRSVRAVARLRFSLSVVAHTLSGLIEDDRVGTRTLGDYSGVLLQTAKEVCTDAHINGEDTGPAVFLIKQISKQFGTDCFMTLAKSEQYSWVLPERLYPPEENKGVDPFVIYGQPYRDIRKGVSSAVKEVGFDSLDSSLKQHEHQAVLLQLAVYERVTLMSQKQPHISKDILDKFEKYINDTTVLSGKDNDMCFKLLRNNLPATSHLNARSPREKILGEIVIHAIVVLTAIKDLEILQPFAAMLHNPGSLKNCYMPTMPEDALTEARKALPGTFYVCPRGHPYLITECGRPRTKGNCSECGLPIGGLDYQLSKKNKRLEEGHDNTRKGYLLQKPSPRSKAPLPVRRLSPTSCLIIRMLMHSALLWASSCGDQTLIEGIQQIIKTNVKDDKLPDFFWNHLLRDIQLLHEDTGKSIDDAALLVHLVLQTITTKSNPRAPAVTSAQALLSTEARAQWETDFTVTCIQPVLQSLDQRLKTALDCLSEDAEVEEDKLFVVVNEMTSTDGKSLTHHLWSYRPRITLGHLKQSLQQMNMQKECPILNQFLNEEPSLRATKYLPEIVQLQHHLYDKYNYRMDQKVAQSTTVAQFLADVKLSSEELSKTYRYLILECLNKAWRLVREELPQHARLRVDEENLMLEVTMETKLDYLIPTTSGHGICTTALVDYLVQIHNAFIERCRAVAQEKQKRKFDWKKLEVPITHINHCHLIDHEEQLYPIILSHCQYSLKAGHGQEVQYDFAGLEKHILKRFIFGKPTILLDIPHVSYQKDVYASVTFQRVREVIHQEPMPSEMKGRVLRDEWTNQQLKKTTDVLEVALGFMSSGAGSAKMSLCDFVRDTLQMKVDSSIKLPDCFLEHTISLWKVLSVKLCKTLTLANEEPFDVEGKDLLQELSTQQIRDLDAALERFNLNQLLESLLEFTLIFVKYMSTDQLQGWPIVGTLEPFLDEQGLPEIPNFHEFPNDIVTGQTIAVWKHIVRFQKDNATHVH